MAILKLRYINYADMFDDRKLNDKKYVLDTLKYNINCTSETDLGANAKFIKCQYAVVSFDTNIDGRNEYDFSENLKEYKYKQCFVQEFYEISDEAFEKLDILDNPSFSMFQVYKDNILLSPLPNHMKTISELIEMTFDETEYFLYPNDLK